MRFTDLEPLRRLAAASGFPYPDLLGDRIEAVQVVVDDQDRPIMAVAAQRIVELYLYCGEGLHPAAKLHAVRMLHDAMAADLKKRGYRDANAFLPPEVEASFGRRLERTFGWVRNWRSWCRTF